MPNGGYVCCEESCAYNDAAKGRCDVFGVETGMNAAFMLCRMYRWPDQTHAESRKSYAILERLKPGVVYAINNINGANASPRPLYRVTAVKQRARSASS